MWCSPCQPAVSPKWLVAWCALSQLLFALPVCAAEGNGAANDGAATEREVQFMGGIGYGWGRYQGANPFRWGVLLESGYTFANGGYVGILGNAYTGERLEHAEGHTDFGAVGLGLAVGYDLRLAERWTVRFALLNAAGAFETTECLQLQPPPSMETCSDAEYSWRYEIGPSVTALYLWEKALFFSELRQTSFLSSSGAIFSGTALVGFGVHF